MCVVCATNEGLYARCELLPESPNTLIFEFVNNQNETELFEAPLQIAALKKLGKINISFTYMLVYINTHIT